MLKKLVAKVVAPHLDITFDEEKESFFDINKNSVNITSQLLKNDRGFFRHIKEFHGFKNVTVASPLVWTFLHEVGHSHTWFEDKDEEDMRVFLALAEDSEEVENIYYNLPNEWEATEWAINYIQCHPIMIKVLNWTFKKRRQSYDW